MNFRAYYLSLTADQRESLADACGTSVGHLRNIAYGKSCNVKLGIAIERESAGKVRVENVCPDCDWSYVFSAAHALRSEQREAA